MITGGAGGIGKATAEQMAIRGIDLILIDFNGKLLEKTVTEFQKKYPDIKIIGKTMDLTKIVDEDEYQKFEDEFRNFKIGILFNNAGIAEYNLLRFTEGTHSKIKGICNLNAIVPTLLCKMVLPQMLERRIGLILTMASASAMAPCAILPVYGSTKIFVRQLSDSLGRSYPSTQNGVVFHEFHPQFVRTPMTTQGPETIDVTGFLQKIIFPDVEEWVKSALKTVGKHPGGSCGWIFFEPMIYWQLTLEKIGDIFMGSKDKQRQIFIERRDKNLQKKN